MRLSLAPPVGLCLLLVLPAAPQALQAEDPPKNEEKKPIFFTIEYDVETATGTVRRKMEYKFKIPEPGKAYEIPDPYDRNRKLYMTFEF